MASTLGLPPVPPPPPDAPLDGPDGTPIGDDVPDGGNGGAGAASGSADVDEAKLEEAREEEDGTGDEELAEGELPLQPPVGSLMLTSPLMGEQKAILEEEREKEGGGVLIEETPAVANLALSSPPAGEKEEAKESGMLQEAEEKVNDVELGQQPVVPHTAVVLMAEGEDVGDDEEGVAPSEDDTNEKGGEEEDGEDEDGSNEEENEPQQDEEEGEKVDLSFEKGKDEGSVVQQNEIAVEEENSADEKDAEEGSQEEEEEEEEEVVPDEEAAKVEDEPAPPEENSPQGSAATEGQGGELENKPDWKGFHEDTQKVDVPEIVGRDQHDVKAHDVSELTGNQGYEGDGFRFHILRPKGQGSGQSTSLGAVGALLAAFLICCCYCRYRRRSKNNAAHRGKYSALHGSDDFFDGTFSDDISFGGKDSDDEGSMGSYESDEEYGNGAGVKLEMGGIHETDANGGLTLREING